MNTNTIGSLFKVKYVSDLSRLPEYEDAGTLLISADGSIYKGRGAETPLLKVSDIILVDTESSLDSIDKYTGKLYLTKDTNILWTIEDDQFVKVSSGIEGYDLSMGLSDIIVPGVTLIGKPIYAAVINAGALPTEVEGSKTIPHGITNMDYLYKLEGFAKDNTSPTNNRLVLNSTASTFLGANAVALSADTTNVYITTSIDYSRFTESVVILYYTKTDEVV